MARRALIVVAVSMAGIAGAYLIQRMTAGNAYAKTYAATEPGEAALLPLDWVGDWIDEGEPLQPLTYFKPEEFGEWWPLMNTDLLTLLDEFRDRLGSAVMISPAAGSLGRNDGVSLSQHNVDMWGEVRAADVMFPGLDRSDLERAAKIAEEVGFTGIGAYPDWSPYVGMHLDVRQSRVSGWPATWAGLSIAGIQRTDYAIERAWA